MTAPHRQTVRVVMHAHSEWSYDAEWPLDRIAQVMPRFGAQVVMMCEHDTGFPADRWDEYRAACAVASTPDCLIVPGIEYSDENNDVHLPTWGIREFLGESRPVADLLADVTRYGGASVFAHPARRDVWRIYDPAWTPLLAGLEVWNRKTDGIAPGHEAMKLLPRTGLPPVVGMDFHRRNQLWPLTNLFEVDGPITEASLVAALRAGRVTPCAFGRPIVDASGTVRPGLHRHGETLRRGLKAIIKRKK
ncbi:CehA/McbA family metallohydrolase domain-containing protein [Arenibacterium sp. CAU 1754]